VSDVEGLLREALRADAESVRPDKIRPLHDQVLPHPGPSRREPSGMHRLILPVSAAAAVAIIAALALVVVPGLVSGSGRSGPGHRHHVASARQASSLIASAAIDSFIPAGGAQVTKGNKFVASQNRLRNLIARRCMRQHHLSRAAQPYVRWVERYVDPPQDYAMAPGWEGENVSLVPNLYNLHRLASGGLLAEVQTGSPNPPSGLPGGEGNRIGSMYQGCRVRAWKPFKTLYHDGTVLADLFAPQVAAIQASPRVKAASAQFGSCVRGQHAPARAALSPDAFRTWLSDRVHPRIADFYGKTALIEHEAAADRHWTRVFVTCAGPLLSVEQRLQLQRQLAFVRAHYRQLLALRRMADSITSALERQYR